MVNKGVKRYRVLVINSPLLRENHLYFVCKEIEDMNLAKGYFIRKGKVNRFVGLDGK